MAIPRTRRSVKAGRATPAPGVLFRDRGFRLAVIDALWNLGHFKAELAAARNAGGEPDDFLGQYRRNSSASIACRYTF